MGKGVDTGPAEMNSCYLALIIEQLEVTNKFLYEFVSNTKVIDFDGALVYDSDGCDKLAKMRPIFLWNDVVEDPRA
jgi:hypothetical protein